MIFSKQINFIKIYNGRCYLQFQNGVHYVKTFVHYILLLYTQTPISIYNQYHMLMA